MLNQDPHCDHPKALTLQSEFSSKEWGSVCRWLSHTYSSPSVGGPWAGGQGGQQCQHLEIVLIFKNGLKWSVAFGTEGFSVHSTLI